MIVTIVQIALFIVSGLCAIGAILFFGRSLSARTGIKKRTYGVERQEARQEMLVYAFVGAGLLLLMILFCGLGTATWVAAGSENATMAELEPDLPTAVPDGAGGVEIPLESELTRTSVPTETVESLATVAAATATPDAISTVEPPTPTPLPTATLEPTPELTTAVVNSPVVGLYLRTAPGGDIVERLEDQAVVILLGPEQTVDEIRWAEVRAELSGNIGWVAADFLADAGTVAPPVVPEGGGVITPTLPTDNNG